MRQQLTCPWNKMAEDFRVNFIRQLWTLVLASFILAPFTAPALGRQYGTFLKPNPGARVYLNPNTGRFWTMDSYEGIPFEPISLNKFIYGADNPANIVDPSGHDGDVITLGGTLGGIGSLAGESAAVTSSAQAWAYFRVVTSAIAIGAVVTGDESDNFPNAMRLQLQEGTDYHYWSTPIAAKANPGVTRKQVQLTLQAMFSAVQLQDALQADWDKFPFSRWEPELYSAIIRMSGRLNTFGPVSQVGTVMQEYLDPTDQSEPRIDLENLRGTNLSQ
jgi:RHS repeat-associated protein